MTLTAVAHRKWHPSGMTDIPGGVRGRSGLSRARWILLTVLSAEVGVLVITGMALFFVYRPTASAAWSDLIDDRYTAEVQLAQAVRFVHWLASQLAMWTAIVVGILLALRPSRIRRWARPIIGAGIAVTTWAASFTGYLLPWDQLALWAVKVRSSMAGYRALFGSEVRFVLIGGVEVSPATIVRWLLVHSVVLGPLLVGLVVLAWRRR